MFTTPELVEPHLVEKVDQLEIALDLEGRALTEGVMGG